MARVLVLEDEEIQLRLIRLHLETAGHTVTAAGNVPAALEAILREVPDLVVADISMPGLDGFAFLAAVRAGTATAKLPVLFLTSLDARDVAPKARALGVREIIGKPLRRDAFLSAVLRCLASGSGGAALAAQPDHTTKLRAGALFSGDASGEQPEQTSATVLFADIRNFVTTAERLSSAEAAALLETYLGRVSEEVESHLGMVVKTMGDGLLALFQERPGETEQHAARALKAAVKIVLAARQFRPWIAHHFPGQELPEFVVGIGVHTGEVVLRQITTESGTERTVIGDTVNVASRLEGQTKVLGWSIVASDATVAAAGARFVVGARASVRLKGRDATVDAGELIGLSPREGDTVQNWRDYKLFVTAITENTEALRRSQKSASGGP